MPDFRHMEESKGATLPVDSATPAIGTRNLMTCVGVYFRVDVGRCFIAHINAPSVVTYPWNLVTEKAGKRIQTQVEHALHELARSCEWDVRDQNFGKNLVLQCPTIDDLRYSGDQYERSARYVLQGIYEFFKSCANFLYEEVQQRTDDPECKNMDAIQAKVFDARSAQLEAKATFLKSQGLLEQVDKKHHCFIVTPSTGEVVRLGDAWKTSVKSEDLGEHSPVTVPMDFPNFSSSWRRMMCSRSTPVFSTTMIYHPCQESLT